MYTENGLFEWDETKADRNLDKHGVSFEEAATVFDDQFGLLADDPAHSSVERRHRLIGESASANLLVVIFTIRHEKVRIISARFSGWKERFLYEQERRFPV